MRISVAFTALSIILLVGCTKKNLDTSVLSPDGKIQIHFTLNEQGEPTYDVYKKGKTIIQTSKLGFQTTTSDFTQGFTVNDAISRDFSEVWKPVWGQQQEVKNEYKELTVKLKNTEGKLLNIVFRAF
ncbi:MAG: glycoside hydrolase family 97 N-terminal domain-containing protein, partial [Spirosomaceae bacterium]|nr:glycoside hydrolase family 97 N-terminal domain-containing protein [Spirosomataceae bacterium]